MTQAIIKFFQEFVGNDIATIIIISMLPIIELRGAIPVGVAMGMTVWKATIFAWIGSTLVSPILLLILKPLLEWMKKYKLFRAIAEGLEAIFQGKVSKIDAKNQNLDTSIIEKRKALSVLAFVAVPIPMTGVWTGSAIAVFMSVKFWKSFVAVAVGNAIAGLIIAMLTYFLSDYIDAVIIGLLIIVVVLLLAFVIKLLIKMKSNKNNDKE